MELSVNLATQSLEIEQVRDLRRSILCGELHWPREVVEEAADQGAFLALALLGAKPVGCARLHSDGGNWQLEALAVLQRFRKQGIGAALIRKLEATALQEGAQSLQVLAPQGLEPYFLKLGFTQKAGPKLEKRLGNKA
jgi:N-acetylglutamate synthase-like GNAT family acetyltransferase